MIFIYPIYNHNWRNISTIYLYIYIYIYNKTSIKRNILRGADKSLARPGKKQATATEDFEFHIYLIYNHNWRNISTVYIYNKTSIKRNILRGADKSLARPGKKQATATEGFEFYIYLIF